MYVEINKLPNKMNEGIKISTLVKSDVGPRVFLLTNFSLNIPSSAFCDNIVTSLYT